MTVRIAESQHQHANNRWLKLPAPNARAAMRLFCFPFAGGAASVFRRWPIYLPQDVEVCAVQLPGREDRIAEQPFGNLDSLVSRLVETLAPYLDRPFALYGHSMGTLIAFELARELRRRRLTEPCRLLVSGRRAPQVPDPDRIVIHGLGHDEFIDGVRRYNGTPEAVLKDRALMDLFVPLLRADFMISETYVYREEPPLTCPISAFAGDRERSSSMLTDWQVHTSGIFETEILPGDHFFLTSDVPRFVTAIARRLAADLESNKNDRY